MVQNKQDIFNLIAEKKQDLLAFGIIRIGLFGSFVSGRQTDDSDIDFLVDIRPEYKNLKNFVAIHSFMNTLFGRKIELVTPQSLNKYTGKYIINQVEYAPQFS